MGRRPSEIAQLGRFAHTRALAPRAVNKPGIVSVLPGSAMRLVVDTTAPVARQHGNASAPQLAALAITYLSSYERMLAHRIAADHALEHLSSGEGQDRRRGEWVRP